MHPVQGETDSLCDFEDPQQPDAPEHREAQRSHGAGREHDHLQDPTQHHEEVEAVEQRHEVRSGTQRVHLHKHLKDKQHQENTTGHIWREEQKEIKGRGSGWMNCVKISLFYV